MANEVLTMEGYLKIDRVEDRTAVASILYKNGYTVNPCRRRKNGKSTDNYLHFRWQNEVVSDIEPVQDGA